MNPSQIVMYTTASCSDCYRAKAFFEANAIKYAVIMIEENLEATEFIMQINQGRKSVPTIVFPDGSVLVEPTWEELKVKFPIL
jgi:mycoredoxin